MRTLPDLLRPGLDVVFVGINPGERSARMRHYYAHPGNGFWPALAASGLVPHSVGPEDDRLLPACWGIGFTDVVKRVVTDSTTVGDAELRAAVPAFRRRIAYARPQVVCFTTTRAFCLLFPGVRSAGAWGRQPVTFDACGEHEDGVALGDVEVWVMPSTSGRAAGWRGEGRRVLAELARALGRIPTKATVSFVEAGMR